MPSKSGSAHGAVSQRSNKKADHRPTPGGHSDHAGLGSAASASLSLVSSQSATTQLQLQLAQQMLAFATQQATLLQQALPFMLPVCPSKVAEKLNQVLNSLHAKPIVEKLVAAGLSELQAQKACLEYSSRYRNNKLTSDAVLQWVKQHGDMSELSRCGSSLALVF